MDQGLLSNHWFDSLFSAPASPDTSPLFPSISDCDLSGVLGDQKLSVVTVVEDIRNDGNLDIGGLFTSETLSDGANKTHSACLAHSIHGLDSNPIHDSLLHGVAANSTSATQAVHCLPQNVNNRVIEDNPDALTPPPQHCLESETRRTAKTKGKSILLGADSRTPTVPDSSWQCIDIDEDIQMLVPPSFPVQIVLPDSGIPVVEPGSGTTTSIPLVPVSQIKPSGSTIDLCTTRSQAFRKKPRPAWLPEISYVPRLSDDYLKRKNLKRSLDSDNWPSSEPATEEINPSKRRRQILRLREKAKQRRKMATPVPSTNQEAGEIPALEVDTGVSQEAPETGTTSTVTLTSTSPVPLMMLRLVSSTALTQIDDVNKQVIPTLIGEPEDAPLGPDDDLFGDME